MTELSKASIKLNAEQSSETLYLGEASQWWRGAVIYQVYPRSFHDTNGDGIGDIRGVIRKLDYIASLGVDALWLSPFFKSPMKDFGYDISDYRDVDPIFGTLEDFKDLVKQSKARGIKIMIDQVLSHTSDQHAWFQESRSSRNNSKADWYVWANADENGNPPNNWIAIFGGSAWEWCEEREQFYLHNFLKSQPDLNYHCDAVRAQILQEMEFWLELGVDGFRLDAINFCYHDKELRSNPFKPMEERTGRGFSPDNPYAAQYHYYDNTQPENLGFLESVRELLNRYESSVALGEINSETSLQTLAEYTQGDKRLHMGYNFELLADEFSSAHIKQTVTELEDVIGEGWPCWAVSNHDVTRVVSRWGSGQHEDEFAKMILAMAASLRGTLCVYQGEELGFTEAHIEQHQLQDPFGIEFWPEFKGRDGCRTPIAWTGDAPLGDFSCTSAWVPVAPAHLDNNVAKQEQDTHSVLNFYRSFLKWRKTEPSLSQGSIKFADAPEQLLAFTREHDGQKTLAVFNLSSETVEWSSAPSGISLREAAPEQGVGTSGSITLQAYGFGYFDC